MADITPMIPAGRQVIQAYGGGGFRINGKTHEGSVVVFATTTVPWPVVSAAGVTPESLDDVIAAGDGVKILLVGCGREMSRLSPDVQAALSLRGINAEAMDTGAACRTFNVLLSEDRAVAAALIAVE